MRRDYREKLENDLCYVADSLVGTAQPMYITEKENNSVDEMLMLIYLVQDSPIPANYHPWGTLPRFRSGTTFSGEIFPRYAFRETCL